MNMQSVPCVQGEAHADVNDTQSSRRRPFVAHPFFRSFYHLVLHIGSYSRSKSGELRRTSFVSRSERYEELSTWYRYLSSQA
jgi:hypothetical protein